MHCTPSGAPGSLLPDAVLGSPLSHRSEYRSLEGPFLSLCPMRATWESWATLSNVPLYMYVPIIEAGRILFCDSRKAEFSARWMQGDLHFLHGDLSGE